LSIGVNSRGNIGCMLNHNNKLTFLSEGQQSKQSCNPEGNISSLGAIAFNVSGHYTSLGMEHLDLVKVTIA